MPQLKVLMLFDNPITSLQPLLPVLQNGKLLHYVKDFDDVFKKRYVERLEGIFWGNNPLQVPPMEIMEQGQAAVLQYLENLYEKGKRPLNELKVLLVGEGAAGKTSLVKALCKLPFDKKESQTHGINIQPLLTKTLHGTEILLHFWDFGGQEIMHATHQFFLSKRSLYLLVLDSRRDEKTEYWLKHIESFGGDSPILVVLNKIDENPSFAVNEAFLQKKYPTIIGFFKVSCQNQRGINNLLTDITNIIEQLAMCSTLFPKPWWNVKSTFSSMNKDFISYKEFNDICRKNLVVREQEQNILLNFLNDLGIVLHYEQLSVHDTQVLNPHWLTNGVYRVINSPIVVAQKGVFSLAQLHDIITDSLYQPEAPNLLNNIKQWFSNQKKMPTYHFPRNKYTFLVGMMEQFELCYQVPHEKGTYILPELLEVEQKTIELPNKKVRFIVSYPEFLPNSILPRLMVRLHENILNDRRWRTGMVLCESEIFNAQANIIADKEEKRIEIEVAGERCQDFLTYIRRRITAINASFQGLKVDELVVLPDRNEQGEEVLVKYQILQNLQKMGEMYYTDGTLMQKYLITDLLEGVEGTSNIFSFIFISYAKEDLEHLQTLKDHLSPLIRQDKLKIWYDQDILISSDWDKEIEQHLRNADVVLLLISSDFLADRKKYIWEKEMPIIEQKQRQGQSIIPIIVRECNWEWEEELAKIQAVNKGQALNKAEDKDTAFANAARQIKEAIDKFKKAKK
jgi:small GTP-binding protein